MSTKSKGLTYDDQKVKQLAAMNPAEDDVHPAHLVVDAPGVPAAPYQVSFKYQIRFKSLSLNN